MGTGVGGFDSLIPDFGVLICQMAKRSKVPLTPEEEATLTQAILESVACARETLDGPLGDELRELGQRLKASSERLDSTILELEQFLLSQYPFQKTSVFLETGLKLHYNDEGLSLEVYGHGRSYDVHPLYNMGRSHKVLALSKAQQLIKQLGE